MRPHTPESFTRAVVRREAEKRGITADWAAPVPEEGPEGLRHAVFKVAERGWCVWATLSPDPAVLPSERDFHPLDQVGDAWEAAGWNGVRLQR